MARCNSCSAPLPANTNKCRYCGIRNDVDLNGRQSYAVVEESSNRRCPHCDISLQTIALGTTERLFIEHCERCFGLFFDPGEIEQCLENSVTNVFSINLKHLVNINKDRFQTARKVTYIKCPVCRNFMSRVNFGYRSGVVVDRCRNHGIWLDSGEITHLMEWKKAGGQLLNERYRQKQSGRRPVVRPAAVSNNFFKAKPVETDWLTTLSTVLNRLFD